MLGFLKKLFGQAHWPRSDGLTTDPGFVQIGDFFARPGVSYSLAGKVSTLYGIIKLLTEAVIPVPRAVYRRSMPGAPLELVPDHPLNTLLAQPYSLYDAWTGWEHPIRQMLTTGNGFWIVERTRSGAPAQLVPAVEGGAYYTEGGDRRYSLSSLAGGYPGAIRDLPVSEVVALHWHGFTGLSSLSPVMHAAAAPLRQLRELQRGLHDAAARGGLTAGPRLEHTAQKADEMPRPEEVERAIAVLREAEAKAGAGELKMVPPGTTMRSSPVLDQGDLVVIEALRWGVEDLARVYSVAPGRLGQLSGGGAGVRTQQLADQRADFALFAGAPISYRLDCALTFGCLSPAERRAGLVVHGDTTGMTLGSPADVASLGVQLVGGGTHTANEVRRRYHGLPPMEGGDVLHQPRGSGGTGSGKASPDGG